VLGASAIIIGIIIIKSERRDNIIV